MWIASYISRPNTSPTGKQSSSILILSFGQTHSSQFLFNILDSLTWYTPGIICLFFRVNQLLFASLKISRESISHFSSIFLRSLSDNFRCSLIKNNALAKDPNLVLPPGIF